MVVPSATGFVEVDEVGLPGMAAELKFLSFSFPLLMPSQMKVTELNSTRARNLPSRSALVEKEFSALPNPLNVQASPLKKAKAATVSLSQLGRYVKS